MIRVYLETEYSFSTDLLSEVTSGDDGRAAFRERVDKAGFFERSGRFGKGSAKATDIVTTEVMEQCVECIDDALGYRHIDGNDYMPFRPVISRPHSRQRHAMRARKQPSARQEPEALQPRLEASSEGLLSVIETTKSPCWLKPRSPIKTSPTRRSRNTSPIKQMSLPRNVRSPTNARSQLATLMDTRNTDPHDFPLIALRLLERGSSPHLQDRRPQLGAGIPLEPSHLGLLCSPRRSAHISTVLRPRARTPFLRCLD
ncbi:hypothetical protein GMRT_10093 [Giardia muris]|uniref:Uncharacterized protein n=1 Tax=Giardia muris TaxID=5742 RepID=A0A4Z1SL48_GIAMU|nr:hypothetical protein GMRT_10093 [Giardia muris]|eukprot:TNJ26210.1 hypothetical protein GMRT_10093 [Giardia muris]